MVEIVQDSLSIYKQSVIPAIKFQVRYEVIEDTIPLRIEGLVFSDDERFIANITELPDYDLRINKGPQARESGYQSKIRRLKDNSPSQKSTSTHDLMFILDKKILDYIEDRRQKTKNRDVVLTFFLTLHVLTFSIKMGGYKIVQNQHDQFIASSIEHPEESNGNLNILIFYNEDNRKENFLFHKVEQVKLRYTIKASDWINDFQEPLGVGKFLMVEVPQPGLEDLTNVQLSEEEQVFKERLDAAYKTILEMENELKKGEWGNVVQILRGIELFKSHVTKYIQKMISQTTNMQEDKVRDLTVAIERLRSYSSELHHKVDSGGNVKEAYTGGKEDAYMAYMLATSLTNLLAKKFKTIISYQ